MSGDNHNQADPPDLDARPFCDNRHPEGFVCDRMPEHEGRHMERWVASWERDGSDPRLYSGVTTSGRHIYREPIVTAL